jgi:hypothetical protein
MILSKRIWLIISGITWFGIGVMLLTKGLRLITTAAVQAAVDAPLIKYLQTFAVTRQQGALIIICFGLLVGFVKGRTVLAKTVNRIAARINSHPEGLTMTQAYDQKYWILLCLMMMLGMMFRFLPIAVDIRGGIDVAIGSALINGAMLYFRQILTPQKV